MGFDQFFNDFRTGFQRYLYILEKEGMRETNPCSAINFSLIRIILNNQSNISLIFEISINIYVLRIITLFLITFLGTIIDESWTNNR